MVQGYIYTLYFISLELDDKVIQHMKLPNQTYQISFPIEESVDSQHRQLQKHKQHSLVKPKTKCLDEEIECINTKFQKSITIDHIVIVLRQLPNDHFRLNRK